MAYTYLQQPVLASALFFQRDIDSFFAPTALGHTGFAYDGNAYLNGVATGGAQASWATEAQSGTRGPLATFPQQALVIASEASLAIVDATSSSFDLWMLFYLADVYGYANNPYGGVAGYKASTITGGNGLISVVMTPDAGSPTQAPSILTVDFIQDTIYANSHVTP